MAEGLRDLGELGTGMGVGVSGMGMGMGMGVSGMGMSGMSGRGKGGGGFWYGYHGEAHTSLVGVRELAKGGGGCFGGDGEVEAWLDGTGTVECGGEGWEKGRASRLGLFAYPGQSNLTGRRLPLDWAGRLRAAQRRGRLRDTYCLLDAAALAMTTSMAPVFADPEAAPDFVCVSFYKIFGFPDLGGLVVRKDSGHILALRKYFGGGTVSMVSAVGGAWYVKYVLFIPLFRQSRE